MGLVYVAKAPVAADICGNGPAGWDKSWLFPGPPWAPGWPVDISPGYSLNLTLGAVSVGAAANLVASVLFNLLDDANLQCHALQITALINGSTLQVSNDNVTFSNSLNTSIKNYSGSSYGFNKNLYLNLTNANIGQSGSITVTNISTNPTFSATVNFTVAGNYVLAAVSSDGVHEVQTSVDSTQWFAETSQAGSLQSICWSTALSLFVAVGPSGTVQTSPDAITWTSQTAAAANNWRSVCWSPDLNLFVAVSSDGSTNQVMTSANGIAWTLRASAASSRAWSSVCWSSSLSLFVAVANDTATTQTVMTSPDGAAWTLRSVATTKGWTSVCWASSLGIFLAVGNSGGSGSGLPKAMSSLNGTAWTIRSISAGAYASVCWSGSVFVAVGPNDGAQVSTSPDGITWTSRTPASANTWVSVCWSSSLGLFVAVSIDGTNRIMTSPTGVTWTSVVSAEQNTLQCVVAKS